MPAMYVKAYVKRGKSDAIDAEAICEAVTRPTMRFVAIKTEEQQGVLFLHRARDLVVRQRTQLSNMLRGLLSEFGIVIAQGIGSAVKFAKAVLDGDRPSIPEVAIEVLTNLCNQMVALHLRILWYDKRILLEGRRDPKVMLLRTIPGVGPVTASAIVATAGDGHQFRNGREFAAWLGLTPINRSSGGKERLGRISKMGDRYLRRLLVTGMTARLNQMKVNPDRVDPWAMSLRERKFPRVATVAMANKTARVIWAVLTRNERYRPHTA
jgi:transposase